MNFGGKYRIFKDLVNANNLKFSLNILNFTFYCLKNNFTFFSFIIIIFYILVRGSGGVEVWTIENKDAATTSDRVFKPIFKESRIARAMAFNENYFAYGTSTEIKVCNTSYELKYSIPRPRSHIIRFSPKGTYLIVYEIYISTKENPNNPNLFFYETATGKELQTFIMKKNSEWEPFFNHDESMLAIMLAGDVHFYDVSSAGVFTKSPLKVTGKVGGFSVSPGTNTHVAVYIQGAKGSPSMARLFKYPNIDATPVASKSFSQADRVEMIWNKKGNGCIILTTTDVDTTGASYYGKQALHFLATNGDSYSVPLSKSNPSLLFIKLIINSFAEAEGPIHQCAWSPRSNQFIVVYGNSPSNATLFNMKCDVVFDFGTGIRNHVYWNDFGNLVLFGAFENFRGNIEVWDLLKKQQIATGCAPDSTYLEWSPSGDLYLTATTSPRLRQGNGFKVWHYSGALLYELIWPEKTELLEVAWQKYPENVFKQPEATGKKIEGIQSVQPQVSTKKYVPPHIREFGEAAVSDNGRPGKAPIHQPQGVIPGLPPGYTSSKPKKHGKPQSSEDKPPGVDDDKKKATVIRKKLKDIKILKEKQQNGDKLDKNQLKKIDMEKELTKELAALKLS